jgi:hypothetical protein
VARAILAIYRAPGGVKRAAMRAPCGKVLDLSSDRHAATASCEFRSIDRAER